ncbi:MAG: MacB family efflux pump subunit [Sphingobium sp.]|nr:MacB family efflux pump subunit [Sphingobium sp.]
MSKTPIISVHDLWREYPAGDESIAVLRGVNLDIYAGEMVAIVGASGSGKSTLMNILGCLDRATRGRYLVNDRDVSRLDADELAQLRREHFGFIFQRYNLLGDLDAQANVEVPAVYSGMSRPDRHSRAAALLGRLGLMDRTHHRPGELSGGQQQRVSIARALMNGGDVIFADEPTGALDSQSGTEVLKILHELHDEGRTIIMVTHDRDIAQQADRIIEISDGEIISDSRKDGKNIGEGEQQLAPSDDASSVASIRHKHGMAAFTDQMAEAFRMAIIAMRAHQLRTFLTMLGIIIGIGSVVSVVAIGQGTQKQVLENISGMGTNTIDIFSGRGFGDTRATRSVALQAEDSDALAKEAYILGSSPVINSSVTGRYRNITANVDLYGVSEQYFTIKGMTAEKGILFDSDSVRRRAQDVVIDQKAQKAFFADGTSPINQVILVGQLPVRIVGVIEDSPSMQFSQNPTVFAPYTTVQARAVGRTRIRNITVRVDDKVSSTAAEQAVVHLLSIRRGTDDFFIMNSDSIRQAMEKTASTMSLLISAIAVISLIVGGIGVMNIMLVSVTERTTEIGVRMAVGARRSDIMAQFLIEAVLVCLIGGVLGIALALGFGAIFGKVTTQFELVFSTASIIAAFACSTIIGLIFGWLPARNASLLDPVQALSRQ